MKNKQKLLFVPMLAAVTLILAVNIWAKPCTGMIETVNGKVLPMSCFYLKLPAVMMSVMWLLITADGIITKKVPSFLFITSGLVTILMTLQKIGGTKICGNPEMNCHTTIWWIRGIGILVLLFGCVTAYNSENQV